MYRDDLQTSDNMARTLFASMRLWFTVKLTRTK